MSRIRLSDSIVKQPLRCRPCERRDPYPQAFIVARKPSDSIFQHTRHGVAMSYAHAGVPAFAGTTKHTFAFPRRNSARVIANLRPTEGAGNAGRINAPAALCAK